MKPQIWNYSFWVQEVDASKLQTQYEQMLVQCGFTVLNFIEHAFEPQGWTGLWLLAESHLAIHTFPEHGRSYIGLSSCNQEYYVLFKNKQHA